MTLDLDRLFESRIQLGTLPTPVLRLDSMSESTRIEIEVKRDDLIGDMVTGTKVRALSFILHKAMADGVTDLITIGEPTSNQCRLVAVLGARHQMQTHLLLRKSLCRDAIDTLTADAAADAAANAAADLADDENVAILKMFGARLQLLDEQEWRLHGMAVKRLMSRIRKAGGRALFIPFGCGGLPGALGIVDLFREIVAPHGGACPYSHIVVPTGSGACLFGLDLAAQLLGVASPPRLIGVSVSQDEPTLLGQIDRLYPAASSALKGSFERSDRLRIDDSWRQLAPKSQLQELQRVAGSYGILPDPLYVLRAFLAVEKLAANGEVNSQSRVLLLISGACRTLRATRQRALDLAPESEYATA